MYGRLARRTTLALVALALLSVVPLAGCSGVQSENTGLALAEEVCSQCHSMGRFYLLEPEKDWNWEYNVPRMVKTHKAGLDGRVLSKEQQRSIIAALENRVPSAGELAVHERCTTCHTLDRVIDRYHITDWASMVELMDVHYGADLDQADKDAMIEFLAATNN